MQGLLNSLSEPEDPQGHHDEQPRQTTSPNMINNHSPTASPHDRILEPDVRNIWKDMGWKGSVEVKRFVVALRDYLFEKTQIRKHQGGEDEKILMSETQDRWAFRYLDFHYLQAVHEAIDDDASGFITIEELNRFTTSRPLDWSLIKWLAYWAIGFNMAMTQQRTAICRMLDEMISLVPVLRRENQVAAREYLFKSWENIITVTASFRARWAGESREFLEKMFKVYIEGEEDRLRKNLIGVKYKIDGVDTLYLVTGPGRIEKNFFALVKVLLERHLQIFHIARTKVLDKRELEDAWNCLDHVDSAINDRLSDIRANSLNRSLESSTWLRLFAHGIYECSDDTSTLWSFSRLIDYKFDQSVYDTSNTYDDSNYKEILVYEEGRPDFLDTRGYELLPTAKQESKGKVESTDEVKRKEAESAEKNMVQNAEVKLVDKADEKLGTVVDHPLIGEWRCLVYDNSISSSHPYQFMFTIKFEAAKEQPQDGAFAFTATDSLLYSAGKWVLIGTCRQSKDGENKFSVTWILKYTEVRDDDDQHFCGTFDAELGTISGTSGSDPDPEKHDEMVFVSQQPAEVLVHRPHPTVLAENRIPSLWKFAGGAIIHQARKKMWSWSYFRDRRDKRKRYLELAIRLYRFRKPLPDEEREEFYAVKRTLYPADARYLVSLELRMRMEEVHVLRGRICENCRGKFGRDRVICMVCVNSSYFEPLELCCDRDCLVSEISRNDLDKPHLPSHRTFKSRKMLLLRDIGFAWRTAESAITRGDKAITEALASYEAENARETIETQANENDKNDEPASKVHEDCTEASGSPVGASHREAQTGVEPVSPVIEAGKQGDVVNPQIVKSTSALSIPLSGALEEPDSSGHAKDNTDKVDVQTSPAQVKDVTSEPPNQSPGMTSYQEDSVPAEESAKVLQAKPETNVDGEPRAERKRTAPPPTMRCYYCDQTLESPCWYCVDCEDTTLICMFCDPPGGFDKGHHKKVHTLLSVRRTREEKTAEEGENRILTMVSGLDSRLESLEDWLPKRMDGIDQKMDATDQRIDQTFRALDERFTRMENLLERLISGQSGQ